MGNVSYIVIPQCYWMCMPWYHCVQVCMEDTGTPQYVVKGVKEEEDP